MDMVESCLDDALELSRLELHMLAQGDVEQAEALAQDRGHLLEMAWRGRGRVSKDQFLQKMEQLLSLHDAARLEAKRLHRLLKDDLLRARKQGQMLAGYRPVSPSMQEARFVSRKG